MTRGQNEDRKNELPGCPGFSPGLTPYFFDAHQWSRSPSHSAACVSLINSEDPKDQAAAKAGNMVALTGRLKPPSSTVAPAFYSCSGILQLLQHFSASSEVVPCYLE